MTYDLTNFYNGSGWRKEAVNHCLACGVTENLTLVDNRAVNIVETYDQSRHRVL